MKYYRDIPNERIGYGSNDLKEIRKDKFFEGFDWERLKKRTLKPPFNIKVRNTTISDYESSNLGSRPKYGSIRLDFSAQFSTYSTEHYNIVRYSTVRYGTVRCGAVECSGVQWSAVECSGVQCSAVECSAVQCSAVQCSAVQCSAVQCSAVQCRAVQCSAVQRSAVKRSEAQYRDPPRKLQLGLEMDCCCLELYIEYIRSQFQCRFQGLWRK